MYNRSPNVKFKKNIYISIIIYIQSLYIYYVYVKNWKLRSSSVDERIESRG